MEHWLYAVMIITAILAVFIIFMILWMKDAVKSAFSGLAGTLMVMAGSLASQSIEVKAKIPPQKLFGVSIELETLKITGTPPPVWIVSFSLVTIALIWLGTLVHLAKRYEK